MLRNIIFDVGNVLLEYRWIEAIQDTGLSREKALDAGSKVFDNRLWVEFDAGNIDKDDLIKEYGKLYPEYEENIRQFIINADRMQLPRAEVWERVHRLKQKGFRIYLLSNYSEYLFSIHTAGVPFMDDLDGRLVSYEVHQVKPGRDIYETLLKRYDLDAKECLFMDDRKENTDTAISLGIRSITIESREHVNSVLDDILNGKIA